MSISRLVLAVCLLTSFLAGCAAVPDDVACAHCTCNPPGRSLSRPLLCSTVGHEAACCTTMFLGS